MKTGLASVSFIDFSIAYSKIADIQTCRSAIFEKLCAYDFDIFFNQNLLMEVSENKYFEVGVPGQTHHY